MSETQSPTIKFYGAMWCGDTRRARSWFDSHNVPYEWIDVDKNKEAEALVKSLNNGFRSIPTIVFCDGSILVEPSTSKLEQHTKALGLIPAGT
ncbi:MAG: NrdH-redoxin [Chloroflexi bacterium]|nr:NrdH-redoxin [Chloroflexota bacterium]